MSAKHTVEHAIYEVFGKGNLTEYDTIVTEDVKVHHPFDIQSTYPNLSGILRTKAADREYANRLHIEEIRILEFSPVQNKIFVHWTFNGHMKRA